MSTWSVEQVEAIAPSAAAVTAARPLATTTAWAATGADERLVWGSCRGSGAEPYDTVVDHADAVASCTCPSRRRPCKHALALLLLWIAGDVAPGSPPPRARDWSARRRRALDADGKSAPVGEAPGTGLGPPPGTDDTGATDPPTEAADDRDRARDERVERMHAGLAELDRWLDDRLRTGLADPALARYGTWDDLAARLVDAQAGSLANRVRRVAGLVGTSPDWHGDVLAELGLLHLLAQAGRRVGELPDPLADVVATAVGWQVRRADVLAGVPETDDWVVAGRSDTREDRIEVRRHWLVGAGGRRWAVVLSFAAYGQSLDESLDVGTSVTADLHRYPGQASRALVGERYGEPRRPAAPPAATVTEACAEIGRMVAVEPWLDRVPATVRAAIAPVGRAFALADDGGSLPLLPGTDLDVLLAVSAGEPIDVTVEWTPHGVLPLAVHLADRSIDIGPRADASFVVAS